MALVGQRIQGGSIVGPLDESTETRFVTFPSTGSNVAVPGIHAPVYLLALACDGALPAMPVGVLDGGAFAWQSDLEELLAQAYAQCAVEIGRRLGRVVQLEGAPVDVIRETFILQADRVSDLSRATTEATTPIASSDHNTELSRSAAEMTWAHRSKQRVGHRSRGPRGSEQRISRRS